jgi:hypothetical protein
VNASEPTTILIIVMSSIAAVSSLTALIGVLITFRAMVALSAESSTRASALMAVVSKLPTLEEVRSIGRALFAEDVTPTLSATVKAALPADVNAALIMETLERFGMQLRPPDPPTPPDSELLDRVDTWAIEGVQLANQAKKNDPSLTNNDLFKFAKQYVEQRLAEHRLEFPATRLAQRIELAVVFVNVNRNADRLPPG